MTVSEPGIEPRKVRLRVSGMRSPHDNGKFSDFLRFIWRTRTLAIYEARAKVIAGNSRNKLGTLWLILLPLLNGSLYYLIFGLVLQLSGGIDNYIGFLIIGVFVFQMTSGTITATSDSIFAGRKTMRAAGLPIAMSPIIRATERWLAGIPSYVVMLLLILTIPPVEILSARSLLFLPLVILQAFFSLGLALIVAHVVAKVHDLKNLIPVIIRGWMFGSGVMFSTDKLLEAHPAFTFLVDANPMHHFLLVARDLLVNNASPPLQSWAMILIWTGATMTIGLIAIWRSEGRYEFGDE